MVLLIVLYMLQGVPLGLTMGTIPMLLASKASYTQVQQHLTVSTRFSRMIQLGAFGDFNALLACRLACFLWQLTHTLSSSCGRP